MRLHEASLGALAGRLASGEIGVEELVRDALERICAREDDVGAWIFLDSEYAIGQARALDAWRKSGRPIGSLHGIPLGIKDIIDTADMPTENGTALDGGRRPQADAAVVARLRAAGAVILGKTVTTELAYYTPGKTRNPHDRDHTPGGSSSGSAAAVADMMVPAAIGTQTNGSVIRPASFCGVVGYKPSFGLVPRTGVLSSAPSLDTVGVFARTVGDAALVADVIAGHDPGDRATRAEAPPALARTAARPPPMRPTLALIRTPVWDRAMPESAEGLEELAAHLGDVDEVELPAPFDRAVEFHRIVMVAEMAKSYARYYERGRAGLSDVLVAMLDEGRRILAHDYLAARDWQQVLADGLDRIFDRYDAIITPAVAGAAPRDLSTTGDPVFCSLWTFCGVPAVTLPLLSAENGLPVGVQLIGRHGFDGRLLRTAGWLMDTVSEENDA